MGEIRRLVMRGLARAFTPFVDMSIQPAGTKTRVRNIVFFSSLRVGEKSLSTASDGFMVLAQTMDSAEFKVFINPNFQDVQELHWTLARKQSESLQIMLRVGMYPGSHPIGSLDIPDCHLVHTTHHDGGYVFTFKKSIGGGKLAFLFANDPVATPDWWE